MDRGICIYGFLHTPETGICKTGNSTRIGKQDISLSLYSNTIPKSLFADSPAASDYIMVSDFPRSFYRPMDRTMPGYRVVCVSPL